MRRCLILRQGDEPPETPGPLSLGIHVPERKESVKGSQAAQRPRALDRFLPFRRAAGMRERGRLGGGSPPLRNQQAVDDPQKQNNSCRVDLRRGTTTSGPGRGPMAGFEVTLYGRICGDHRGRWRRCPDGLHIPLVDETPLALIGSARAETAGGW